VMDDSQCRASPPVHTLPPTCTPCAPPTSGEECLVSMTLSHTESRPASRKEIDWRAKRRTRYVAVHLAGSCAALCIGYDTCKAPQPPIYHPPQSRAASHPSNCNQASIRVFTPPTLSSSQRFFLLSQRRSRNINTTTDSVMRRKYLQLLLVLKALYLSSVFSFFATD
jgi:hypothetical protein